MGEPAEALAKQFEQISSQLTQAIEQCSDDQWRALCKGEGWSAVSMIRGLSDEQLDRTATIFADMPPMSARQVIENILVGHAAGHLESIRAAL